MLAGQPRGMVWPGKAAVYPDKMHRYNLVLSCLPESTLNFFTDFVEGWLPVDLYSHLRARFLAAHQLTDSQRVKLVRFRVKLTFCFSL